MSAPAMEALPAEIAPRAGDVAVMKCWSCAAYASCVFVGGWVGEWRCGECIADRWFIADQEGIREVLDQVADLAGLVAMLCRHRWLPDATEEMEREREREMLDGVMRAHAIKVRLDFMAQSPR